MRKREDVREGCVDNDNGGNINSYTTINGQIIRITTDPSSNRIISAGIVQARNIAHEMPGGKDGN